MNKILCGNCLNVLKEIPDNSIDACVTDPPYGLTSIVKRFGKENSAPAQHGKDGSFARLSGGFMGKLWDGSGIEYNLDMWRDVLRVLKPGGHLLSFGGSRTYHRMACAIEDAGFEIRDQIMWVYGSGFPKSLDISKAIDKTIGRRTYFDEFRKELREIIKTKKITQQSIIEFFDSEVVWHWFGNSQPQIPSRKKWIELKEFLNLNDDLDRVYEKAEREIIGEREDFVKRRCKKEPDSIWNKGKNFGSLEFSQQQGIITAPSTPSAIQWQGYGTALKPAHEPIVLARKPLSEKTVAENVLKWGVGGINIDGCRVGTENISVHNAPKGTFAGGEPERGSDTDTYRNHQGRFPANLIHDGSQEVLELFPNCKGWAKQKHSKFNPYGGNALNKSETQRDGEHEGYNDSGSAARFFYCAKASKAERNKGCETEKEKNKRPIGEAFGDGSAITGHSDRKGNNHPTVKPLALMKYLVTLVTREGQTVLDPFMGSGTTGVACKNLNRNFIGIELDGKYFEIAKKRIEEVI